MIRFKSAGMYTSSIIKLNYYPKVFGFLCDSSKRTLSYLGRLSPIHLFLVDTWNGWALLSGDMTPYWRRADIDAPI